MQVVLKLLFLLPLAHSSAIPVQGKKLPYAAQQLISVHYEICHLNVLFIFTTNSFHEILVWSRTLVTSLLRRQPLSTEQMSTCPTETCQLFFIPFTLKHSNFLILSFIDL